MHIECNNYHHTPGQHSCMALLLWLTLSSLGVMSGRQLLLLSVSALCMLQISCRQLCGPVPIVLLWPSWPQLWHAIVAAPVVLQVGALGGPAVGSLVLHLGFLQRMLAALHGLWCLALEAVPAPCCC
jgi:hypothetical protein